MKRRDFLSLGVSFSAGAVAARALLASPFAGAEDKKGAAAKGPSISDKDIMKDGMPATIANYCENPPAKACADWKTKPGHCKECTFFNKDNSETTYKGKKYAHCQLLTDPKKPQFVSENGWCSTFVKKS